ncbi:hypothetical protein V3W47_19190 [Deinococcus sp. YIM 134068]|uniref:hypothetical protein n=1 Tax=Deinococcus lichenicola TaxID=3118910 RepID=UPI002F931F25
MLPTLLAALALASAPKYDVFLGMPEKTAQAVRGMVQTMKTDGADWTPEVETTASVGPDTLVMWSWPLRGNHGIGLQIYGPDGKFKTRLDDSNIPSARAAVCGGRYVVGGGNTLRVWDARQDYRLIFRKTFPNLSPFARLSCPGGTLLIEEQEGTRRQTRLRLMVPTLTPAR